MAAEVDRQLRTTPLDSLVHGSQRNIIEHLTFVLHKVSNLSNVAQHSWLISTPTSCEVLGIIFDVLTFAGYFQVAVFSALRIYAITGGNRMLAAVVLGLGLTPIGTNAFILSKTHVSPGFSLITRISQIIADLLVVTVTWRQTFGYWKDIPISQRPPTVSSCLLRDGTVYFFALLLMNIAQILTRRPTFGPVAPLIAAMPPILVSRFMLNLRQVRSEPSTQSCSAVIPAFEPTLSSADYGALTSIIGNIGEPLVHGECGGRRGGVDEEHPGHLQLLARGDEADHVGVAELVAVEEPAAVEQRAIGQRAAADTALREALGAEELVKRELAHGRQAVHVREDNRLGRVAGACAPAKAYLRQLHP
ncbi:uncharacterized protein PHACADRAFT_199791 [Phanerochaete carnosa HHB-10118-sp]|uniref:Uncharacterized protein n=1 Tax=Phanerochaete carnosa (strain HHB-10118-sp) TaxID=650164 RepID=K5VVX5_PHACS|nr:uncharacterized protein PHACADRAFT_199791 [Phanerochaete carnosa HHB-10118-sp]EKM50965.1 hypothetical protein PHACADRAFT_199791 [Phanerochaete carnosa HHB-10118-sp]